MKSLNLKNFHKLIINTQYNLSNSLINSLTPNLIGHDCLFEHLFFIYQLWMNSQMSTTTD